MNEPVVAVTVTNHNGDSLRMEYKHPSSAGLFIANMTGLGSPKANINMTNYAVIDGAMYNSSRAQSRNITMTIQPFQDDMEMHRHRCYELFPVKKKVRLLIETVRRTCYIDGFVETCEPNIFTKEQRVFVSILCPDPYFREISTTRSMYYRAAPAFHFPIGTVSNPPPYELGVLSDNYQIINVDYDGDADTGVLLYLEMDGQVGDITLTNSSTRETMHISADRVAVMTGQALGIGDAIQISTIQGDKYINLIRAGESINLISALSRDSDWLTLTVGNNRFAYTAASGKENIVVRVEYATAFVGV